MFTDKDSTNIRRSNIRVSAKTKSKSRELDQFYTRKETAKDVIKMSRKTIGSFDNYKLFVEPSAGTGSLYNLLPKGKRIGVEIELTERFIHRDFLSISDEEFGEYVKYSTSEVVVIGNPPFGKNSSTAIEFVNRCSFIADTICMILPATFNKTSIQNKINLDLHLIYSQSLPKDSFIFEDAIKDVPSVFQIWKRKDEKRVKVNLPTTHNDFHFLTAQRYAQYTGDDVIVIQRVGQRAGQIMPKNVQKSSTNYYYIVPDVPNLRKKLEKLDLENHPCKYETAGMPSISKTELIQIYSERYKVSL